MSNTTTIYDKETNLATDIPVAIIILCAYSIGLFLHTKIILVSKKEKGLMWGIDVTNSI